MAPGADGHATTTTYWYLLGRVFFSFDENANYYRTLVGYIRTSADISCFNNPSYVFRFACIENASSLRRGGPNAAEHTVIAGVVVV